MGKINEALTFTLDVVIREQGLQTAIYSADPHRSTFKTNDKEFVLFLQICKQIQGSIVFLTDVELPSRNAEIRQQIIKCFTEQKGKRSWLQ